MLVEFYTVLFRHSNCKALDKYILDLIIQNKGLARSFPDTVTTSTSGLLVNLSFVLMKMFFREEVDTFQLLFSIDTNYPIIPSFEKLDKLNAEEYKNISPDFIQEQSSKKFNLNTRLFFFIHGLLGHSLPFLDKNYQEMAQKAQNYFASRNLNDPQFKNILAVIRACDCYIHNPDYIKTIMKFMDLTCHLIFTSMNKKYSKDQYMQLANFSHFDEDFALHIHEGENFELSVFPECVFKNIVTSTLLLRKFNPDVFTNNLNYTRIFSYFSIIYSSRPRVVKNPHLRSEILDILEHFFINANPNTPNKLLPILKDPLISDNLMSSLARVFIDSEKLGGSNQFYEKFSVRYKILFLIESVKKGNRKLLEDLLYEFLTTKKEDSITMINFLINDLTFLIDESIDRLEKIKQYQDLKSNIEEWNNLSEEEKKDHETKYQENHRVAKSEIQLMNSSLQFAVTVTSICQSLMIEFRVAEKLARLINYTFDIFISEKREKLEVKNFTEYKFDPSLILKCVMEIYASFKDFDEFIKFVISDERSFRIENFVNANEKIGDLRVGFDVAESFRIFFKKVKKLSGEKQLFDIDYDDAPEDYLDPITAFLMEDPVLLPSGKICDRYTIEQHIMSDPIDPFNRAPLEKSMLIPQPELKEKIEEYKRNKLEEVKREKN